MSNFKASKVVYSLPSHLEPNMTYWVRTGEGFDLYLTDTTGQAAHKLNDIEPSTKDFTEIYRLKSTGSGVFESELENGSGSYGD